MLGELKALTLESYISALFLYNLIGHHQQHLEEESNYYV